MNNGQPGPALELRGLLERFLRGNRLVDVMRRLSALQRGYLMGLHRAKVQAQRERDDMADRFEDTLGEIHTEMRGGRDFSRTVPETFAMVDGRTVEAPDDCGENCPLTRSRASHRRQLIPR